MNNEKYGIDIEVNTKGFQKTMEKAEEIAEKGGDYIENYLNSINLDKIEVAPDLNLEGLTKGFNEIDQRIQEISSLLTSPQDYGITDKFAQALMEESAILKANEKIYANRIDELKKLAQATEEAGDAQEELNDKNNSSGMGKIEKGFKSAVKSIKRFTLSLFGVRSVFTAVNKAMSTYMQNDQELADKMQSIWTALGVVLAPVVEYIADLTLKLSKYVLYIMQALTGVDLLERALNKTQKQLTKSLSSMDEITNLSEQSSLATLQDLLKGVDIDTSWADMLVSVLQPIYNIISKIVDFSIKHPAVLATIFGTYAFLSTASTIIGLFGGASSATGLAGIYGLLLLIGAVTFSGLWTQVNNIKSAMDDLKSSIAGLKEQISGNLEQTKTYAEKIEEAYDDGSLSVEQTAQQAENLKRWIEHDITRLKYLKDTDWYGSNADGIADLEEEINLYQQTLEKLTGETYTIELDVDTSKAETKWYDFFNPIKSFQEATKLPELIGELLVKMSSKGTSVNSYDVGTNYVPNDQLAMVHEGEAIVPKQFNSKEYFSNFSNNSETNELLMELIEITSDNSDKVPVFEMDGRQFAKATYQYYTDEGNRLGVSTSIKRS
jgi:methyl-accepting chemotaxis protein